MSDITGGCPGLGEPERELLRNIQRGMSITADLSRSDVLLLCHNRKGDFTVVAQARPHSIASLYPSRIVGQQLDPVDYPAFQDAWQSRRHVQVHRQLLPSGAPVIQDVYPIFSADRRLIALFSVEISQIQLERHRTRDKAFQQIIEALKRQCMRGDMADTDCLTPFTEWDGVVLVDAQRRITYLSGVANNLFRRLGYLEDLRNRKLSLLNTADDQMAVAALNTGKPLESEAQESSLFLARKVVPVWGPPAARRRLARLLRSSRPETPEIAGLLILVHDATEERRKKQELKVKATMIQEVHHRVKNNLQTVAAMLRMQARRSTDEEAVQAIQDAVGRILSVAVIHEFLSRTEGQSINIRDVCQRIISQNGQVAVSPGTQISFSLEGPNIYLPSQQATACALVVNELIQNAVEHGFEEKKQGQVRVCLTDLPSSVRLDVWDDGERLPDEFNLNATGSLGLQIVRTLVEEDLHGSLTLANADGNVLATAQFPKHNLAPEES